MIIRLFNDKLVIPFTFASSNRQIAALLLVNWVLMFFIYLLQINIGLVSQYGQSTTRNLLYSIASYFTYSQLFIFVATSALFSLMLDKVLHRDGSKWYKTQRF